VRWSRTGSDGDARLQVKWIESGGPAVEQPSRRGFGQVVTEQLAARALQGTADLRFEREGVRWTLDIPPSHLLGS